MPNDATLKNELTELINRGNAHASFEQVVKNIPFEHLGIKPNGLPYSIWRLVEHIRITQWDILEFCQNTNYKPIKWPDDYWPATDAPANEKEWDDCIAKIKADRAAFLELLNAPNADLYTAFAHGEGQNLLREALLIADHNSHHVGQVIILRRLLNDWKALT